MVRAWAQRQDILFELFEYRNGMHPLESSRLKLKRAKHHIDSLNRSVKRYRDANSVPFRQADERDILFPSGPCIHYIVGPLTSPPDTLGLILGDIITNLRACLDHLTWALSWKYAPEDKIRIVLEGFRREVTVSDLCRREGIKPGVFYAWTKEFMEAGKERLTRDTVRDAARQEIEPLKRENYDLKQLVADLSLEVHRFKKTAIPAFDGAAGG